MASIFDRKFKENIFESTAKLFIPYYCETSHHYAVIQVNMIYKEIIWFDPNQATITSIVKAAILKNVLKFIEHQSIHYTETFNVLQWHLFDKPTTLPLQLTNNCDSGVFMLKYVDLLMDDLPFDIDQAAISNYRNILALFIISCSLTY